MYARLDANSTNMAYTEAEPVAYTRQPVYNYMSRDHYQNIPENISSPWQQRVAMQHGQRKRTRFADEQNVNLHVEEPRSAKSMAYDDVMRYNTHHEYEECGNINQSASNGGQYGQQESRNNYFDKRQSSIAAQPPHHSETAEMGANPQLYSNRLNSNVNNYSGRREMQGGNLDDCSPPPAITSDIQRAIMSLTAYSMQNCGNSVRDDVIKLMCADLLPKGFCSGQGSSAQSPDTLMCTLRTLNDAGMLSKCVPLPPDVTAADAASALRCKIIGVIDALVQTAIDETKARIRSQGNLIELVDEIRAFDLEPFIASLYEASQKLQKEKQASCNNPGNKEANELLIECLKLIEQRAANIIACVDDGTQQSKPRTTIRPSAITNCPMQKKPTNRDSIQLSSRGSRRTSTVRSTGSKTPSTATPGVKAPPDDQAITITVTPGDPAAANPPSSPPAHGAPPADGAPPAEAAPTAGDAPPADGAPPAGNVNQNAGSSSEDESGKRTIRGTVRASLRDTIDISTVSTYVQTCSEEDLRIFVEAMIENLYQMVRKKLRDMLEEAYTDAEAHGDVPFATEELLFKADDEVREQVFPTMVDHIVWLIREEQQNVHDLECDLMMVAYAGQHVDTIITNAVLKTKLDLSQIGSFSRATLVQPD